MWHTADSTSSKLSRKEIFPTYFSDVVVGYLAKVGFEMLFSGTRLHHYIFSSIVDLIESHQSKNQKPNSWFSNQLFSSSSCLFTYFQLRGHAQTTWTVRGRGGCRNDHVCPRRGEGGWSNVYVDFSSKIFPKDLAKKNNIWIFLAK